MNYFEEMCRKIKVIVSEVDSVITDGFVNVSDSGHPFSKNFSMVDFEAINILKKHFKFVFISTDNYVSYNFMRNKNIPFFWVNQGSKLKTLKSIMSKYGVGPEEILYIGALYSDIECAMQVPLSMCTFESPKELKEKSYEVIEEYGGNGIISRVLELLKPEIKKRIEE